MTCFNDFQKKLSTLKNTYWHNLGLQCHMTFKTMSFREMRNDYRYLTVM